MNKFLKVFSLFVFFLANFAANTPSQLGLYQMEAPNELKK